MERVELVQAGHETLVQHVPVQWRSRIRAIMFNLGYLPGGDKDLTTQSENTLDALAQALDLMADGGMLSLIAYRGHPGGMGEFDAVSSYFAFLDGARFTVRRERPTGSLRPGPVLFLVSKNQPFDSTHIKTSTL
jgi:hypothetical protein